MEGEHLGAVCGLYCGACTLYRAWENDDTEKVLEIYQRMYPNKEVAVEELRCDGCLSEGHLSPYCHQCKIRQCAAEKPGVTRCSDCLDFPCSLITKFSTDGVRHHAEVLKNIRRQQKVGVDEWLQEEYERMRCQLCGVSLDWYAQTCHRCGTAQPFTIPSMLRDGSRLLPYYYRG